MSGRQIALDGALALAALNLFAGAFAVLCWYRSESSRAFWRLVRTCQAAAVAYAALAGLLYLAGDLPANDLYYLYALLPVAINFVAEQFRVISADHVLGVRDLDSAAELGQLELSAQEEIVLAIIRRETAVMGAAGFVVAFLALRAWGTY
jgi:hypothetical protein